MTARRNLHSPSAGIDPAYAWAVGDRWLIDRGDDELDAEQARPRISGGGAEAEPVFEDA